MSLIPRSIYGPEKVMYSEPRRKLRTRAHGVSKLAPLGWWTYHELIFDIKREEYSSDCSYENARTVRTARDYGSDEPEPLRVEFALQR